MAEWYYVKDGNREGPVDSNQLKKMAADGNLLPEDQVWRDGMEEWVAARSIKGLFAAAPPPLPPRQSLAEPPMPPAAPAQDMPPRQARRPVRRHVKPHRGTTVLVFGILGLVVFFVFGIVAWIMGSADIKAMKAGRMDPSGMGQTNAGRILGIISCSLVALAVLLAIAIPMFFTDVSEEAIAAKRDIDISTLQSQCELYRAQMAEYPSSLEDLTRTAQAGMDVNGDGTVDGLDKFGPWIRKMPIDPLTDKPYTYDGRNPSLIGQ
jgi:hypothetical protein